MILYKMPDYSKTLIYKLTCDADPTFLYVGSTVQWNQRKYVHKKDSAYKPAKVYQQIRALGGWDNIKMILVETYLCNNNREQEAREQHWMDQLKPNMNMLRAYTTREQMLEQHRLYNTTRDKEDNKRRCKTYREANREEMKQKACEVIECECGGHYTRSHKALHMRSKVHQEWAALAGVE